MSHTNFSRSTIAALSLLVFACAEPPATTAPAQTDAVVEEQQDNTQASNDSRFGGAQLAMPPHTMNVAPAANGDRVALFGDLHVHTEYSFDAYAFGTIASPDDAYRYAQGEAIKHPAGFDVQLRRPLDFYAVTDHAMFLGAVRAAADPSTDFSRFAHVQDLHDLNVPDNQNFESLPQRVKAFTTFLPDTIAGITNGAIDVEVLNDISRDAWAAIVTSVREHNKPGEFTTFVAY